MSKSLSPISKGIMILLGIMIVTSLYRALLGSEQRQQQESNPAPQVTVMVNRQSSDGVKQDHMNQKFLDNFESYTKEKIVEKIENHYKSRNINVPTLNIKAESNYIVLGSTKLAIVRVFEGARSNSAMILGIIGDELVRVGCFSESAYQVEVSSGECGEKIEQTYGVSFQ